MQDFVHKLNQWGSSGIPFLFVIDFEMQRPFACRLEDAAHERVWYDIRGKANFSSVSGSSASLVTNPISFEEYEEKFNYVTERLRYGDSFLTNLTLRTEIKTDATLLQLLHRSKAKYKLLFRDEFLVFSPETFVRIVDGVISTNPMKGTIDASKPLAKGILLDDPKELAEHVTIVDLLRNDLSRVATNVSVSRFRYIEEVKTAQRTLLQASSEITGTLQDNYAARIGSLLVQLLPAGSVTGAPKARTVSIIREAEQAPRGYYTGVFGYFDGSVLDSGVMIRFIEADHGKLFYRSGGGITTQSTARDEYQEALDKIYVPID